MGWTEPKKVVPLLTFVLVASVVPGCGGGGGDNPVVQPPCLRFTADSVTTAGEVTAQRNGSSTCDQLVLDLVATDIDDVWGMGCKVTYRHNTLTYQSMDHSNTFLDDDGVSLEVQDGISNQVDNGNGTTTATIAITRVGPTNPNISASGDEIFATLVFRRVGTSGTNRIDLSNPAVTEAVPGGGVIVKNPQPLFRGGTVSITR